MLRFPVGMIGLRNMVGSALLGLYGPELHECVAAIHGEVGCTERLEVAVAGDRLDVTSAAPAGCEHGQAEDRRIGLRCLERVIQGFPALEVPDEAVELGDYAGALDIELAWSPVRASDASPDRTAAER